ncbi:MAG: HAD family phosphatase [Bacteroidales bacterium]|nr:HAD family phosphatase [Bacteroidales bacterium]
MQSTFPHSMNDLTIIFDMDGVILDSEKVYQEIERQMYAELGISITPQEHQKFMGTSERSMWTLIKGKYKLEQEVEALIREERERFLTTLGTPGSIPLMEGLLPLLESLRKAGIPLWLASSSAREIIDKVVDIKGLRKYYEGIVSGDDVKHSKPSPEIFLLAAKLAGNDPSRCLVIEDSENGIRAARAAGMTVVALRDPESPPLDLSGAHLIIDSLTEFDAEKILEM